MDDFEQTRRFFLMATASLGIGIPNDALTGEGAAHGSVLGATDGEHLVHFRDRGDIYIKLGAATGSSHLAIGTQQVMTGTGIPIHRHFKMDEAFQVLEGSGRVLLNDVPHSFEKGTTIFIPRNTWHGFENPDHELLLLWMVTPSGLDGFFRDTCSPPGAPPKPHTRDQIREIARTRYDTEFR